MNEDHIRTEDALNPYIAFSDVGINLVLILVFFMAAVLSVGRGWMGRYRLHEILRKRGLRRRFLSKWIPASRHQTREICYYPANEPTRPAAWHFAGKETSSIQTVLR